MHHGQFILKFKMTQYNILSRLNSMHVPCDTHKKNLKSGHLGIFIPFIPDICIIITFSTIQG